MNIELSPKQAEMLLIALQHMTKKAIDKSPTLPHADIHDMYDKLRVIVKNQ